MRALRRWALLPGACVLVGVGLGPVWADDADVAVVNNAFEPAQVTIATGESVTWRFQGTAPHSVTADDGSFDSHPACRGSNLVACSNAASPAYTRRFDEAGSFPYYCKIHGSPGGGGMSGVVVVQGAGGQSPPPSAAATTTRPPGASAPSGASMFGSSAGPSNATTSTAAAGAGDATTTSTQPGETALAPGATTTSTDAVAAGLEPTQGDSGPSALLVLAAVVALGSASAAGVQMWRRQRMPG